jgi:hypothetical protein
MPTTAGFDMDKHWKRSAACSSVELCIIGDKFLLHSAHRKTSAVSDDASGDSPCIDAAKLSKRAKTNAFPDGKAFEG